VFDDQSKTREITANSSATQQVFVVLYDSHVLQKKFWCVPLHGEQATLMTFGISSLLIGKLSQGVT